MKKLSNKYISIRKILIIAFVIILVVTTIVIAFISFSGWLESSNLLIDQLTESINHEIYEQISSHLHIPEHVNEVNKDLIERGVVNLENTNERDKFFATIISTHSLNIYSVGYGKENGDYFGARRNPDNQIEIMRNSEETNNHSWYYALNQDYTAGERVVEAGYFDPRSRVWYQSAKEADEFIFSPVYKHFTMEDLTVSAATPIYTDGEMSGVLATHFTLTKINYMLEAITEGKDAYTVIYEKDSGLLVANSFGEANFYSESSEVLRAEIGSLKNELANKAFLSYLEIDEQEFEFRYDNVDYFVSLTDYSHSGINWIAKNIISKEQYLAGFYDSLAITLFILIIAILVAFNVYLYITNNTFKPIDELVEITESFTNGDFSARAKVYRIDEIGRLTISFNDMADTLEGLVHNLEDRVSERTNELEKLNEEHAKSRSQLKLLLDSTAEGIYGIDLDGKCTFINQSGLKLLGYDHEKEVVGKNMHSLIHHSDVNGNRILEEECKIRNSALKGEGVYVDDEVFWTKEDNYFHVGYNSYPQVESDKVVGTVVSFRDITKEKENLARIEYLSYHDSLTGLYNRLYFDEVINKVEQEKDLPIAIVIGDVNGLKLTNDVLGHNVGDKLLKKVAEAFTKYKDEKDIAARVGGDEFILVMPNTTLERAERVAKKIKEEFITQETAAIKANIALGCEVMTSEDEDIREVIKDAEDKMYYEKSLNSQNVKKGQLENIINTLHTRNQAEKEHADLVSELSKEAGIKLGFTKSQLEQIERAGFYHDIGKVFLDGKYERPRVKKLNEKELQDMKQHPIIGFRILNSFDETVDIADIVLKHHEMYDGSGYPKGIKGDEVPLQARIIAAIEFYDSLINGFSGKHYELREVIQEIKSESGKKLDPMVASALVDVLEKKYIT